MPSFTLIQPTSTDEAVSVLSSATPLLDSPTNHRHRTGAHLESAFVGGIRRPEWVWAARDADGHIAASVTALACADGFVLDHWTADSPEALAIPLAAATAEAHRYPGSEARLYLPPDTTRDDAWFRPWDRTLIEAGWRPLVERRHYEWKLAAAPRGLGLDASLQRRLGVAVSGSLRLEPLTGPDDPRLRPLVRSVMTGSLDAHHTDAIGRLGLDAASDEFAGLLLDLDPWECIRLAYGDGGVPVGLVSWVVIPDGRGFVNFIGVASDARGHGLGRRLLALATDALVREGATSLVADTDVPNVPMANAFAAVGWPQTETCIDYVQV